MPQDYQTLIVQDDQGVRTITMNRPATLNAVNEAMLQELAAAFTDLAHDPTIRSVILTGAGRAFGSGQDLNTFVESYQSTEPLKVSEGLAFYHRLIRAMRAAPQPIIAMVQGVAAGASCNLALACDLRIAAETARFIEAFARIALVPDAGGPYFLTRLVGLGKALELALLADEIDGREAERLGLVNRCVPLADLEATTRALALRLAHGPTRTYGLIKDLMYHSAEADLETAFRLEGEAQDLAFATRDHREGVMAFLQKRPAEFKGE